MGFVWRVLFSIPQIPIILAEQLKSFRKDSFLFIRKASHFFHQFECVNHFLDDVVPLGHVFHIGRVAVFVQFLVCYQARGNQPSQCIICVPHLLNWKVMLVAPVCAVFGLLGIFHNCGLALMIDAAKIGQGCAIVWHSGAIHNAQCTIHNFCAKAKRLRNSQFTIEYGSKP